MRYYICMMKPQILIVDDDPQICDLVVDYLSKHGYNVISAGDGRAMQKNLKSKTFDLIILDVMLPGDDGISLCRQLREESHVPILMLSAMSEDTDRIVGLEVGADDYLPKPFNPRELLARIKALLRRASGEVAESRKSLNALTALRFNDWTLDRNKRHLIAPDGVNVALSSGEYDLLVALLEHAGRTLTRDQLLDLTQGREAGPFDRSIDVQIARLRKKIELDPKDPKIILTIRGGGYQFNSEVEAIDE